MYPENLDSLLREGAASAGVELYHWELAGGKGRGRLLVYIDTADGVTSADCERASRAIEKRLDEDITVETPFMIEVSSPGIERELHEPWHYERARGKKVRVRLHNPHEGQKTVTGRLDRLSGEAITLNVDSTELEVPLSEVARAQVVFEPKQEGR